MFVHVSLHISFQSFISTHAIKKKKKLALLAILHLDYFAAPMEYFVRVLEPNFPTNDRGNTATLGA